MLTVSIILQPMTIKCSLYRNLLDTPCFTASPTPQFQFLEDYVQDVNRGSVCGKKTQVTPETPWRRKEKLEVGRI